MLPVWQRRRSDPLEVRKRKQLWEPWNHLKNVRQRLWEWPEPRSATRRPICFHLFINSPPHSPFFSPPARLFRFGGRTAHCARRAKPVAAMILWTREGSHQWDGGSLFVSLPLPTSFLIASILLPFLERPYYHRLSEDLPAVRRFGGRSYP